MVPTLALLASPLLGASSWRPAAAEFARRGVRATVCSTTGATAAEVLDQFRAALPDGDVVLVPHSNAGAYVPALIGAAAGAVFVDAVLPPRAGRQPLAPPGLLSTVRALADADGVLPPWTRWWPDEDVDRLFPDTASRAAVEADQPRLPLTYFTDSVVVPSGWDQRPCAYLALSDTYAPQHHDAAARGWPTDALHAGHLHQFVAPAEVADHVTALLDPLALN